jgi:RNA polymerase-binding transcription factor DksA
LIRKELKALKELKKKDLNSSKVNINNNENEIANLTREIGKLERFKKDVRKIKNKDFLCSKFN